MSKKKKIQKEERATGPSGPGSYYRDHPNHPLNQKPNGGPTGPTGPFGHPDQRSTGAMGGSYTPRSTPPGGYPSNPFPVEEPTPFVRWLRRLFS